MPPKKISQNDKLEELISKLEDRLAIFNKEELKTKVAPLIKDVNLKIEEISDMLSQIEYLFNIEYSDLH